MNVMALVGITVFSSALAVAGAGGALRVILYLLMRNQTAAVEAAPVAQSAPQPMVAETTSVAA